MAKKIAFQDPATRTIGLLADEAYLKKEVEKWVGDDHSKLLMLCRQYEIKNSPTMFYELALALARKLYPEPKKSGRKSKWTLLNKGALVVEVERLVIPGDPSHGVEWACKQLAKREPWLSFIDAKGEGTLGPDPTEVLRRIYFDFRSDKWAKISRDAFKMYQHEEAIEEWESQVCDFVRNPHPK